MKIILLKAVKGLGQADEIVEVADGYGRNYLVPHGLAVAADKKTALAAAKKSEAEGGKTRNLELKSLELVERLKNSRFEFEIKADKKGHLYAGLKEDEILAKIRKGGWSADAELEIVDYRPIKQAGNYKAKVKIGQNSADVNIIILAANDKGR